MSSIDDANYSTTKRRSQKSMDCDHLPPIKEVPSEKSPHPIASQKKDSGIVSSRRSSRRKNIDRVGGNKHLHKRQKTGNDMVPKLGVNKNNSPSQDGHNDVELLEVPSAKQATSDLPSHIGDLAELSSSDAQAKEIPAVDKSSKGASWVQKSSWRDLVGDSNSGSFSIFSVLPGKELVKSNTLKLCDLNGACSNKGQNVPEKPYGNTNVAPQLDFGACERESPKQPRDSGRILKDDSVSGKTKVDNGKMVENKCDKVENSDIMGSVTVGNACTFMRTTDSRQQWLKAKSAMSSYLRKKSIVKTSAENNGSRRRGF